MVKKNIYFDDRYDVYNQYTQFCSNTPIKSVQICNKILNENKECLITKDSGKNDNYDRKTFKTKKCQMFYKLYNSNGFVCNVAQKYSSFDFINKFDKEIYNVYQSKCEMRSLWSGDKPRWIYNASSNKCLYAQPNIDSVPLLKECKNDANYIWYHSDGVAYYATGLSTKRYLNILNLNNPVITLSYYKNNDPIYFKYDNGLIFPDELRRKKKRCMSVNGNNGIALKTCNQYSNDQKWSLWDENPQTLRSAKTRTVWIYNRKLNMCIESGKLLDVVMLKSLNGKFQFLEMVSINHYMKDIVLV
ncbi:hypothetical protein PIROE2DRAFT_65466 [Piromyces sp. E2]|nr:hypothetical protein PIROE2DRAFT_65466 [Piromyces sp. E2]|eukprot:OUM56564.1 hypothetical protein PIROE2DRAFT_65466 [Piromyces sp. E2]